MSPQLIPEEFKVAASPQPQENGIQINVSKLEDGIATVAI